MNYSDYIVYVDESGDHGMTNISPEYPIFVLTFCVFKKNHYCNVVLPRVSEFKMKYWGHNEVVLHVHDIRTKKHDDYKFLNKQNIREDFMNTLSQIMQDLEFFHVTTIIDKKELKGSDLKKNIYEIAMLFCMERLHRQLQNNQSDKKIDIFIEQRGKKEDRELELEFRRILDGCQTTFYTDTDFSDIQYTLHFAEKAKNITGLQIADLIARPIGINHLKPDQPNQAYDIIAPKNEQHAIEKDLQLKKVYP